MMLRFNCVISDIELRSVITRYDVEGLMMKRSYACLPLFTKEQLIDAMFIWTKNRILRYQPIIHHDPFDKNIREKNNERIKIRKCITATTRTDMVKLLDWFLLSLQLGENSDGTIRFPTHEEGFERWEILCKILGY